MVVCLCRERLYGELRHEKNECIADVLYEQRSVLAQRNSTVQSKMLRSSGSEAKDAYQREIDAFNKNIDDLDAEIASLRGSPILFRQKT